MPSSRNSALYAIEATSAATVYATAICWPLPLRIRPAISVGSAEKTMVTAMATISLVKMIVGRFTGLASR